MDILISNLFLELIFDFGKWSNWKYANTRFTPSRSQNFILKEDLKWECPYYNYKKNVERFGQYLKKSKNGFPNVVSNLARKGSGVYFHARVLIFHQMPWYLTTVGGVKLENLTFYFWPNYRYPLTPDEPVSL